MIKYILFVLLSLIHASSYAIDPIEKIEKIITAKILINDMLDNDPTLTFHEEFTAVNQNKVTLKFSFNDKKGIVCTYTLTIILGKGNYDEKIC